MSAPEDEPGIRLTSGAAEWATIAAPAVPKVVEVELVARLSDGSRTIVRYLPEPNEGMRVQLVAHEPVEAGFDELPVGSPLLARRGVMPERHTIEVRDAAQVEMEYLVRAVPGR